MKRVSFASPQEMLDHCLQHAVDLIVEYTDELKRHQQVRLTPDTLDLGVLRDCFTHKDTMAYYREDGIFYEIEATWL